MPARHPALAITRRHWLAAAAAGALSSPAWVSLATAASPPAGPLRRFQLVAQPAEAALFGSARAPVPAWAYGDRVPGPEIRVRQGERLRVEVLNRLPEATTVHWHGIRLPHAMDGVPYLTQAPIEPGARFVYEFDLPDAGTYWYHPHLRSSEQLDRGLYGVLVVEERQQPRVDRDITWVLDDWRITQEGRISESFGHPHDISHAGRIGNVVTLNGLVPGPFAVRRGERVRLRLLNAANARIFGLEFGGHRPRIIAIDGHPVTPHEPAGGRVVIAPAMRVDLILDATGEPDERHAVRDTFYPRMSRDLLEIAYEPTALREQLPDTPVALAPNPLPEPDLARAHTHAIRFEGGAMGRMHSAVLNGETVPMMQLMRAGKAWAVNGVVADSRHHHHEPMLTLQRGATCLLAMHNDTRWHHPIHLHGHAFRVLRRNGEPTAHREWQDTVLMAPGERVDIAFVADNPGDWMFHCHVLEHQDGGMMSTIRVL